MNGFFNPMEWLPVVSSAFAVSFLLVPLMMKVTGRFLSLCAGVLGIQAVVGMVGLIGLWALGQRTRSGSTTAA